MGLCDNGLHPSAHRARGLRIGLETLNACHRVRSSVYKRELIPLKNRIQPRTVFPFAKVYESLKSGGRKWKGERVKMTVGEKCVDLLR